MTERKRGRSILSIGSIHNDESSWVDNQSNIINPSMNNNNHYNHNFTADSNTIQSNQKKNRMIIPTTTTTTTTSTMEKYYWLQHEYYGKEYNIAHFTTNKEERILLFRSTESGSIGKIVFSVDIVVTNLNNHEWNKQQEQVVNINVTIHLLSIKEPYRGYDLGGLLMSQLLWCIQQRYALLTATTKTTSIICNLVAKEDMSRYGRLIHFYEQFGFSCTIINTNKNNNKISNDDINEEETAATNTATPPTATSAYRKVPMQLKLNLYSTKEHISRLDCPSWMIPTTLTTTTAVKFVPISLCAIHPLQNIMKQQQRKQQPLTVNNQFGHWLMVIWSEHGPITIQSTRYGFLIEPNQQNQLYHHHHHQQQQQQDNNNDIDAMDCCFLLQPVVCDISSDDCSCQFFQLQSTVTKNGLLFLDVNWDTLQLILTNRPTYWEWNNTNNNNNNNQHHQKKKKKTTITTTTKDEYCLLKTTNSHPSMIRHLYQQSWSNQCVSFIVTMRQQYTQYHYDYDDYDCPRHTIIYDALYCAKNYSVMGSYASTLSYPYNHQPSLRTVLFATAELARKEGQPDFVQLVALIYGLAMILCNKEKEKEEYNKTKTRTTTTIINNHPKDDTMMECNYDETDKKYNWMYSLGIESRIYGCLPCPTSMYYNEFHRYNPDNDDDDDDNVYNTPLGIYTKQQGLESVLLSWNSTEYMYYWLKHYEARIPHEAYLLLKLSPLVDWHSRGEYTELATHEEEKEKQTIGEFYQLCERGRMITTIQSTYEMTDEECNTLWHNHYATIVRKYIDTKSLVHYG